MSNDLAKSLLDKYIAGTCTDEEYAVVEAWYAQWNQDVSDPLSDDQLQIALKRVETHLPVAKKQSFLTNWSTWYATAAIVLIVGLAIHFFIPGNFNRISSPTSFNLRKNDIGPGSNKAVLTLPNGKTISLSALKTGLIVDGKKLNYNDGTAINENNSLSNVYNAQPLSIETPRGGTYQISLPDGSKVWLNAASKLEFPTSFKSKLVRKVMLEGEAYFEIAKDKKKAFIVETKQQQVKVLGTHFNINSYPDQNNTKTTLIEGSVQLTTSLSEITQPELTLVPGQQAILTDHKFQVQQAVINEVIAWKNGLFIFNGEKLDHIMQQIARWYDVDITFKDNVQNVAFTGVISNKKNISTVLEAIEETGNIRFKIEGRSVTVMK